VFDREPPLNVPYEFLNIGGKKMSTSKGRGAAAHTIAEVIPPEQLRFLFLRPRPNQAIEFDPDGTDAIPRLFDEFDRFAAATTGLDVKGEMPPGYEATFRYSLLDREADVGAEAALFRPAFSHLALLLQIPGVDVPFRVEMEKGSALNERERLILDERAAAAQAWLAAYAPESARIAVRRDGVPEAAAGLDSDQRKFLAQLANSAGQEVPASGDAWQARIFDLARLDDLPPRRAFEAIYIAFLGRPNGPRAGWLLASLDRDFVQQRAWSASGWTEAGPPKQPEMVQ
jgi:lysyl-tRNA synthetase class 1